jgi:hypothetical protein
MKRNAAGRSGEVSTRSGSDRVSIPAAVKIASYEPGRYRSRY